ncbi:MAG: class I SAM-dependent methyltransferase [Candidatus Eremiobacteraeota bacterium]|nr:class I SAM-dependent methyltransferase [Candidatus Eremiobacteraeota bacterium]
MADTSPPAGTFFRTPHPLVEELSERIPAGAAVLLLGIGSGRNAMALLERGYALTSVDDSAARARNFLGHVPDARVIAASYERLPIPGRLFDAAVSTHALLHGDPRAIERAIREVERLLHPESLLVATFGSSRDARFGRGIRYGPQTFASTRGDEAGVPHSFFNEAEVRRLLDGFHIESLAERNVDDVAGTWAHEAEPLRGSVHWFAIATVTLSVERLVPRDVRIDT